MNNKKLDAYLRHELKKIGKDYKREKARCARLYPDWVDDEFNMLDNLFIWGYNIDPKITPSFYSWDDAYIYYNRATKRYYMTIDTGFYGMNYSEELAQIEIQRLSEIDEAFRNFLIEKGLSLDADICFEELSHEGAYSLSDLYVKFKIKIEGYKYYVNNKPQS